MLIHVIGAGIIGLACAHELARRGHDVVVVDPAPGSGASHAAAGMLSPAGEAWHGEPEIWELGLRSAALWPSYAASLAVTLHRAGTLLVGHDAADGQLVRRQRDLLAGLGVEAESLSPRELRRREPTLGRVGSGLFLADDGAVDPRAVVAALLARVEVTPTRRADRPDVTVLATGSSLPTPYDTLVRGVRGEIVRARCDDLPRHVVRGWVRGEAVYVVPRADGEVVIGATVEEHPGPPVVTLGGVERLLAAARVLVPSLDRAVFLEAIARDRPATLDHLPLVGPVGDGVWLAAGHFRHGVLLAPLTAELLADSIEGVEVPPALDPRRFISLTSWEVAARATTSHDVPQGREDRCG